jgi:hypothetical protein
MQTKTYYFATVLLLLAICALLYALIMLDGRAVCAAASLIYVYYVVVEDENSNPLTDCIQYFRTYGDGWSDTCMYTTKITGPFEELRSWKRR